VATAKSPGWTARLEILFLDSLKKFSYAATISIMLVLTIFPPWYPLSGRPSPGQREREKPAQYDRGDKIMNKGARITS